MEEGSLISQNSKNNSKKNNNKSNKKSNRSKEKKKSKAASNCSLINIKSYYKKKPSTKINLENQESSLFQVPTHSSKLMKVNNYNNELYNKFSNFLKEKKFKISDEFNAKNSKNFLVKKNKCLEKIVLSDIIENENNIEDSTPKIKRNNSKRKMTKGPKNYCIIVSNYDDKTQDEKKFNYTVKYAPRKLKGLKKNKNLCKYFLNVEDNSQNHCSDSGYKSS